VRKGHALANKILQGNDLTKDRKLQKKKNKDLTR
jgi:hypothetical protein